VGDLEPDIYTAIKRIKAYLLLAMRCWYICWNGLLLT